MIVDLCQGQKTALQTLIVTFDTAKHSAVPTETLFV